METKTSLWFKFKELCSLLAMLSVILIPLAAWLTHIIYSIMVEKYLLLIAGAIFPPIGMIHGIGVWFG